jgi:diacylglycerol kinase family enzyme
VTSPIRYLPNSARHVIVAANPNAGARSGLPLIEQLAEFLRKRGYSVEMTTDIDQVAARSAAALANRSLRAVVAAGGDGTVGLVVNKTQPGVPVAVLPLGTENLLAQYMGVTADAEAVGQTIHAGAAACLDAGRAGDRLFLLMFSCGFDAEVVRRLHSERQGHIHHLSYAKPILDAIRSYEYPAVRVYCEQGPKERRDTASSAAEPCIEARWVFVVNLPRYAVGLQIVPEASGTDGLLDVCTFKEGSLWNGLLYLGGVLLGQHQSWTDCVTTRTRRLRIESSGEVPYQLDGDPGGFLPVEIDALPGRLTLLVPEAFVTEQIKPEPYVLCPQQ